MLTEGLGVGYWGEEGKSNFWNHSWTLATMSSVPVWPAWTHNPACKIKVFRGITGSVFAFFDILALNLIDGWTHTSRRSLTHLQILSQWRLSHIFYIHIHFKRLPSWGHWATDPCSLSRREMEKKRQARKCRLLLKTLAQMLQPRQFYERWMAFTHCETTWGNADEAFPRRKRCFHFTPGWWEFRETLPRVGWQV